MSPLYLPGKKGGPSTKARHRSSDLPISPCISPASPHISPTSPQARDLSSEAYNLVEALLVSEP